MLFAAWLGSNTSLVKIDARIIRACLSVVCFSGQAFPSPLPGWNTDAFLQHAQLYQDPKLILIEMSETGASPLLRRWGLEFFLLQPPPFPGSTAPVHAPQFLLQQLCSSCLCQTPLLPGPAAGIGILLHREYWAAPMCPHPHNLKIPTAISLLSVCSVGDHLPAKYCA